MLDETPTIQPISEFLAKVSAAVREEEGHDAELLSVLEKHILLERPQPAALRDALLALEQLAADRAQQNNL